MRTEDDRGSGADAAEAAPLDYRATLACRVCGRVYLVHKMMTREARYWHCHRNKLGRPCGTMNIWREREL